ncbi:MAG: hypothetical protein ACFFDP_12075, partial [Promethearchaeota archaeon]
MRVLSTRLQVYGIVATGELEEVSVSGELKTELKPERVLIIVDDEDRKIWLWKGTEAGVRHKFIAARQAQAVRSERGLVYKVLSIDESEEPSDFLSLLGMKAAPRAPKPEVAVKVELPDKTIAITSKEPTPPAPSKPEPKPTPSTTPVTTSQLGQEYEGADRQWPQPPPSDAGPAPVHDDIIGRVQDVQPPSGYRRELVVIGHEVFTSVDRKVSFLGKSSTTSQLERTRKLPNGPFFGGDYTPRILVESGRVLATEFLKKTDGGAPSLRESTRDKDVGELIDLFRLTMGSEKEAPDEPKPKPTTKSKRK